MELRDYLRIIRKRVWLIVLAAVLCSGTALVMSKATTPVYEATAKLLVVAKVDPGRRHEFGPTGQPCSPSSS